MNKKLQENQLLPLEAVKNISDIVLFDGKA